MNTSTDTTATQLKDVMAGVCTPVAVVTAMDGARPHGTTVSAFASLSMTPPMVLVCLERGSELLRIIRETEQFGMNILGSAHSDLATTFARKGLDKFDSVDWDLRSGVPKLVGTSGWLACVVSQLVDGGDHVIAFGRVKEATAADIQPLTYHKRKFGTHAPLESVR